MASTSSAGGSAAVIQPSVRAAGPGPAVSRRGGWPGARARGLRRVGFR